MSAERVIVIAMRERADAEGLWDMRFRDIDLDTMAEVILDALQTGVAGESGSETE